MGMVWVMVWGMGKGMVWGMVWRMVWGTGKEMAKQKNYFNFLKGRV